MKKYENDFVGKVAIVTGSSSGIGAAIARRLAENGANITLTGRSAANLAAVAAEISSTSTSISVSTSENKTENGSTLRSSDRSATLVIVGDLLDREFARKLIEQTLTRFGQIDFLINCAGAPTRNETFENAQLLEQFDQSISVNVRSAIELTQLCVPHLERTRGSIVNISSAASQMPWMLLYSTTKAALDMFTKTSAGLLGPKGIRVNAINPGPTYTANGRFFATENYYHENREQLEATTALGRIGRADEIANLAVFLLSPEAINITGSIVACDGGVLVHMNG